MTDKVIHVNVTSTKSQRVSVSPGNVQNEITATPDSSQYYSNLAKNWAIGAGLILNEDYSSKHYANESANSASSAKNYAEASQATYTNVQNVANTALTDIEDARVDAVDNITTVKSESIASVEAKANEASTLVNAGIAEINTTKTNAVNAVTTTKNNAVTEINKEVTDGKKELNDIIEAGGLNINDKITNCLLEVPQNIKLELNDGTLTLKAGSKVIVPNGVGVFEEVVTTQDYSKSQLGTITGQAILLWGKAAWGTTTPVINYFQGNIASGDTAPTPAGSNWCWYDTANNIVKTTNDKGVTWVDVDTPLPFAIVTADAGAITSIDQVFNGMGYIGSTIWVDKGVKCLIPNGRNADGTLNNIEFTTSKVATRTIESNVSGNIVCVLDRYGYISRAVASNYYYDADLNESFWFGQSSVSMKFVDFTTTNGVISSFQPKQPVRLVDYNDLDDYVKGMPVGTVFSHTCSASFVPENSLPCNGSEYTQAQFPNLYNDWLVGGKLKTCTYTEYSNMLTTYGQCPMWALDTTNKKFKVPTIKDGAVVQQAMSNTEIGKAYNAGLPNITGHFASATGAIYSTGGAFTTDGTVWGQSNGSFNGNLAKGYLDASRSNSIYGNSTTVQMNAVALRYFVVVATKAISQSAMNWSSWASSLNGKLNADVSNLDVTGKSLISGLGMPSNEYIDLTLGASGTTYTAPANGWFWVEISGGNYQFAHLANVTASGLGIQVGANTNASAIGYLPTRKNDIVNIVYGGTNSTAKKLKFIYAEGEV